MPRRYILINLFQNPGRSSVSGSKSVHQLMNVIIESNPGYPYRKISVPFGAFGWTCKDFSTPTALTTVIIESQSVPNLYPHKIGFDLIALSLQEHMQQKYSLALVKSLFYIHKLLNIFFSQKKLIYFFLFFRVPQLSFQQKTSMLNPIQKHCEKQ